LQPYQETKLYISPHYLNTTATTPANTDTQQQQQQQHTVLDATFSTKLKRRNIESSSNTTTPGAVNMSTTAPTDPGEVNIKDLLDSIVENLSLLNISQWFSFNTNAASTSNSTPSRKENLLTDTATNMTDSFMQTEATSMFDSIHQALNHIDFNLKRNSDFINELTKLLDTSKALKLESQMKKMTKLLDEEKLSGSSHGVAVGPASQPGSPSMRSTSGSTGHNRGGGGDDDDESLKKKSKTKGFKLSTLSLTSKSVTDAKHAHDSKLNLANQTTASVNESTALLLNMEDNFRQLKVNDQKLLNSSDYNELEKEVEKISYELDSLFRLWTRVYALANNNQAPANNDQLKSIVEFQILIGNLNSQLVVKELDQALFKINWLITSKSGFYEPNWQSCVLSLTPSTNDSFVGVNLLKTYYKYVKYDFVSYKLFTRQLQLIQLCAIILNSIHRILLFYREIITLSSITNNLNGPNGTASDLFGSSLLSFNFSSDKYRPISWSANHVTLYNVQNSKATTTTTNNNNNNTSTTPTGLVTSSDRLTAKGGVSRNSSTRRDESRGPQLPILSKEDQIRQIKIDVFIRELNDFLQFTTNRLNIQANMANRTGYFYIVNKSTGLVLQAADFTSDVSLKEHIEQNQKRLQNTSVKSGQSGKMNNTSQSMSKGPRFYLLPKIVPTFVSNTSNTPTFNKSTNEQPTTTTTTTTTSSNEAQVDEQLWYYYLINGCIANKIIRSGYCMAASSMNTKSPVCFWPNVKTTNCSWFYNSVDQTISSGLNDDLVLDYIVIDEPPNQRYAVVIDTKVPNKISQKWSYEFC
jgi:hypothetical protein